jgi:hypothetical protein
VVVNAGSKLTVNHIVQNALVIGGTEGNIGTVTIAASDAAGNSLVSAAPAAEPQATVAAAAVAIATPTLMPARPSAVIHNTIVAAPLVRVIEWNGLEPRGMSATFASRPDERMHQVAHGAAFSKTNFASVIDDGLVDLLAGSIRRRHRGADTPTPVIDEAIAEWRVLRG